MLQFFCFPVPCNNIYKNLSLGYLNLKGSAGMNTAPLPRIAITTDIYWPTAGGVTESIRSIISAFRTEYRFTVITTSLTAGGDHIDNDPSGIPILTISPGRLYPFLKPFYSISKLSIVKKWFSPKWFDFLYRIHRLVFLKKRLRIFAVLISSTIFQPTISLFLPQKLPVLKRSLSFRHRRYTSAAGVTHRSSLRPPSLPMHLSVRPDCSCVKSKNDQE